MKVVEITGRDGLNDATGIRDDARPAGPAHLLIVASNERVAVGPVVAVEEIERREDLLDAVFQRGPRDDDRLPRGNRPYRLAAPDAAIDHGRALGVRLLGGVALVDHQQIPLAGPDLLGDAVEDVVVDQRPAGLEPHPPLAGAYDVHCTQSRVARAQFSFPVREGRLGRDHQDAAHAGRVRRDDRRGGLSEAH